MLTSLPNFVAADESTFRQRYTNFAPLLDRGELELWERLNNDAAFQLMRGVTLAQDLPAVAGITKLVASLLEQVDGSEFDYIKKGIGAIVCQIMEANGFQKTGIKRSVPPVPRKIFNRAELYRSSLL